MSEEEAPLDPVEELMNSQADLAEEFIEGLLDRLGLDGEAVADLADEQIVVDVNGPDLALLIGHHGSMIESVQDLTRAVVNHRTGERAMLMLDIGGYRAKRREALQDKARRIADEVLESGEAVSLAPMAPYERKAIHDAIADIDGVWSDSEGEGLDRYVVVHPSSSD
jgi:spoIIIJ-associated protein